MFTKLVFVSRKDRPSIWIRSVHHSLEMMEVSATFTTSYGFASGGSRGRRLTKYMALLWLIMAFHTLTMISANTERLYWINCILFFDIWLVFDFLVALIWWNVFVLQSCSSVSNNMETNQKMGYRMQNVYQVQISWENLRDLNNLFCRTRKKIRLM